MMAGKQHWPLTEARQRRGVRNAKQAVPKVLSALPPERRRVQLEALLTVSVKLDTEAIDTENVAEDKHCDSCCGLHSVGAQCARSAGRRAPEAAHRQAGLLLCVVKSNS